MCHVSMINYPIIMEKAACTLGLITLQDQKIKSNNYHFLCVGHLINILGLFLCNILTGSIDTVPRKSDISFMFENISMACLYSCNIHVSCLYSCNI